MAKCFALEGVAPSLVCTTTIDRGANGQIPRTSETRVLCLYEETTTGVTFSRSVAETSRVCRLVGTAGGGG